MPFDTLILNGTIVDGTNTPRYKADLGLTGGRIAAIGDLGHAEAARRIDATGHVVAPGFIDMHAHSDVTLLDDPGGESKAHQGVTTEVTGNCGYSPFPAGIGGPKALQDNLGKTLIGRVPWTWNTLDEWADIMHSNGISINVAPQLGNAALQVAAGAIEDRRATQDEMRNMKRLAAEAMEMGSFSLSTGLSLAPSGYASTDEVVELCKAVSGYEGAFYVTHARVGNGNHISAIEEAIEIGQRAEIPVQFSHMAITDRRVFGEGPAMIDLLVEARKQGLDITYDVYPYTAAGASFSQLVPLWAQTGTVNDFVARLRDPSTRVRVRQEVAAGIGGLEPLWDAWHVAYTNTEENRPMIGKSIEEIADIRSVEPAEAVLQLLEEEGGSVPTRVHNRDEGDVRYFLSHDLAMIGSDGRAVSPTGPYANALPHPRFYGTYPRILGRYVREEPALLTLESAIHKMTGFPAVRMGMKERGLVKEGLVADLVVFDPDTVIDNATWEDPHQYPTGIPYVLVSGTAVVDGGKHTRAMPGKVLRRGDC
jgi:N-acyl-D-amino-acid deacylase